MRVDSDLSNMIFFVSIACIIFGQFDWAIYLIVAAIYISMMEHGINPINVSFTRTKVNV